MSSESFPPNTESVVAVGICASKAGEKLVGMTMPGLPHIVPIDPHWAIELGVQLITTANDILRGDVGSDRQSAKKE